MTLRQQFDDIMRMADDSEVTETDEAFIETVVGATKIKDEVRLLDEKFYGLQLAASKKQRQLRKLMKKAEKESTVLKEEKKKTERMEEEKHALESVLEEIRRVITGQKPSNAEILSLINSLSLSDTSLER